MSLYPNEKVFGAHNYHELVGDGKAVHAGGELRLLSAMPRPANAGFGSFAKPFSLAHPRIPRSDWSEMLKEQIAKKRRTSDFQNFPPMNQGSYPTCWTQGPCGAATTVRVINGLPYVELSGMSIAVPISGGHSGGWEGEAIKFMAKYGCTSVAVWDNQDAHNHSSEEAVKADRELHKAIAFYDCENFDDYATACLLNFPCPFAYNWMSHVQYMVDLVEISPKRFGLRARNSWGNWGAKNDHGQPGYQVYEEGHGTPDSGFALQIMTPSQS